MPYFGNGLEKKRIAAEARGLEKTMGLIRILSEKVASQIAAGEVVERPASVVRELIDNSIDAGATRILIKIEHGGRNLIRVADNGTGMDRDDLLLCAERHATSKISELPIVLVHAWVQGKQFPALPQSRMDHIPCRINWPASG
jgi:DNA mismatch repair protein MutL